jgi:hypothetical protein
VKNLDTGLHLFGSNTILITALSAFSSLQFLQDINPLSALTSETEQRTLSADDDGVFLAVRICELRIQ